MRKAFGDATFTWPFGLGMFASVVPFAVGFVAIAVVTVLGMSERPISWALRTTLVACGVTAAVQLVAVATATFQLALTPQTRTRLNLVALAIALFSLGFLAIIGWVWRIETHAL